MSAETPSNAQQKAAGTGSTNAGEGGLATVTGVVGRAPAAGVANEGCILLSLIADFAGESEAGAIRAVSLRGPTPLGRSERSSLAGGVAVVAAGCDIAPGRAGPGGRAIIDGAGGRIASDSP